MKDLKDKVAVVTGAASGIGLAMAEELGGAGMRLVLADVEEGALARADTHLRAKGARTLTVRTDVSNAADVDALGQKTLSAFGAVHVVCNNAGVAPETGLMWECTVQDWQWVLGVNLWGVIHGIKTFVPMMLQHGGEGHIVNTASMAGHLSVPLMGSYQATKFAVVTLSETLHHELAMVGAKVKVSVLCPGFVKTNIMDSERNRPAELRAADAPTSEFLQALRASFTQLVTAGMPPAQVAAKVVDAIREERFWIFPHPEILALVQRRIESILSERNPQLDFPAGMQ